MERFLLQKSSAFGKNECRKIASYYRKYLQNDILKNWADKTEDKLYGGYITAFDRKWQILGYDKGAWGQARHVFSFSTAYRLFNCERKWLKLAETGIDFIKKHMYNGKGRLYYLTDRTGSKIKKRTISVFSDAFFILGLSQYIYSSTDTSNLNLLKIMYSEFEKNIIDTGFQDTAPYRYENGVLHHAVFMIALNAVTSASSVLGMQTCQPLMHYCIDRILNTFLDKKYNCIVEKKKTNGDFCDGYNSRLINVGHTYECMHFLLDAAKQLGNDELIKTASSIVDSTEEQIEKTGKVLPFSFALDAMAEKNTTWEYESTFAPNDNVSWTYAEALCLFGCLAVATKSDMYFSRFKEIHNTIQKYFIDTEYGDWFHALNENFEVIKDFKGSVVKTAFHIPRALMKLIQAFETFEE